MPFEFKLPDLGEGIHEGEIKKWLVKAGDRVQKNQAIAEVETDKAVVEIPTPKEGLVVSINVPQGTRAKTGQTIITIKEDSEIEPSVPKVEPIKEEERKEAERAQGIVETKPAAQETYSQNQNAQPSTVLASPFVRKVARELGVDISKIKGTGELGKITEQDVRKMKENAQTASREEPKAEMSMPEKQPAELPKTAIQNTGNDERVPLRSIRKKITDHLVMSHLKTVMVTHMDSIDITELVKIREAMKPKALEKGVKLTYLPFVARACEIALKKFPYMNAMIDEERLEIVLKKNYHLGIAVDTEEGLKVPVVKNVDWKSILTIAKEIEDLATRTRNQSIKPDELRGSTFSITNIGSIGGEFATPILNYPECAILGMSKIEDKPVVREGQIVIRKMMNISLTFDHRIADGAYAARFANEVKKHLEDPNLLLLEID